MIRIKNMFGFFIFYFCIGMVIVKSCLCFFL